MYLQEIDRVLNDFWELGFPDFLPRCGEIIIIENMISTIVGARRVGKSTRVLQYAKEQLLAGNIESVRQIVWVDFDNPILAEIDCSKLHLIEESVLKNNPEFDLKTKMIFIFDEIHKVAGWENYCIQLSRNQNRTVLVTGSSSKLLRDEISTELRGKSISTRLYGLSFSEYLDFNNIKQSQSTKGIALKRKAFDEYLHWGAFPALTRINDKFKVPLLREYFDTMMLRDLIQRYRVSKPDVCIKLIRYLLSNISKPHTLKSSYEYLKSCNFHTSRDSVRSYINYAEDSFLLHSVPIFSDSLKDRENNYKKIYCVDWMLAVRNSSVWDGSFSRAFENMVYIELLRRGKIVHYYLTRSKREEIDFVVTGENGKIESLIQASINISNKYTLERELRPLISSSKYFNVTSVMLITYDAEKKIELDGVVVNVIPAWKWFLYADC